MSARELLAVPSSPQMRVKANCGFCGQPWFGDVAYCPYCGRQAAGAPAGTVAPPPPARQAAVLPAVKRAQADAPDAQHWKLPWVTAAAALAFVAIGVSVTSGDRAEPQSGASASTAQAPPADPVMPRADVAPPAPHRSLCSAANEAAGLCNPQ